MLFGLRSLQPGQRQHATREEKVGQKLPAAHAMLIAHSYAVAFFSTLFFNLTRID